MAAAENALLGDQSWLNDRNNVYQHRRDIVIETLRDVGFTLDTPKASLYVWAKIPKKFKDSIQFCNHLLNATGVSITPGVVYGKSGAGYIRISLVINADRLSEAMRRLKLWIKESA